MASPAYPHAVMAKLQTWGQVANRLGLGEVFRESLREMNVSLSTDAESWGDPVKDMRHMHLTVYHRSGPMLIVKYAVHIDGSPVFVLDVQLTPDTPLYFAAG
ncbi:MAG: hypothetical protein K8U57_07615 [Planctomycetes bacterium]|nr:hypothetical protein [Planctomycetota bacterium]